MISLVAEFAVNWNDNFELVQKMMLNAKTLGCNSVKFQVFDYIQYENAKQLFLYI